MLGRLASPRASRFASGVALLQILPDVVDRVAKQIAHASPGEFGRALGYGLQNGPVLMQAVVLDLRGALPAQFERALEGGADEAAKRGEKVISGPLENAHVEVEIRPDEIARAIPELVHAAIGAGDPLDRGAENARFAASAAASGSIIWRSTNNSATKLSVGVDCKCQLSTSGSSMFQSAWGRMRVPILGLATIIALAVSTL